MNTAPERRTAANRRASRRLAPKARVKVVCRKGSLDLGRNLALALLDASETGLRMALSQALEPGQDVSLTLDRPTGGPRITRVGMVVWAVPAADGSFIVGIHLQKHLPFADLAHLTHL
jgi:hypothetical protein